MTTYGDTLTKAKAAGAGKCSDAELMALFCQSPLQMLVGAASPRLVWEGAQKRGLTAQQLTHLAQTDPPAVHALMWEA